MYEDHKEQCLQYLRGMFAFAIWDRKNKTLFLARDRLGIKPLYYSYINNQFVFASELKALIASKIIPNSLNRLGVQNYFLTYSLATPLTIFENSLQLPAGNYMMIKEGIASMKEYWDIPMIAGCKEKSRMDYLTCLREKLEDAVKLHLYSEVPFGVFLSGGIDSSIIAALTSKILKDDPHTFSIGFEETEFSEIHFASQIAKMFKTNHTELIVTTRDIIRELPRIIKAMDQPTGDGINSYFISQLAAQNNIKTCLSGIGGDEIFGGYDLFKTIPKIKIIQKIAPIISGITSTKRLPASFYNITWLRHFLRLADQGSSFEGLYSIFRTLHNDSQIKQFFTRDFLSESEKEFSYVEVITSAMKKIDNNLDDFKKISYLEMKTYMQDILFRDADIMSMQHSLEIRVPLVDHEFVEAACAIPSQYMKSGIQPKQMLIDSVKDLIPREFFERKKQGFIFPFELWMRTILRPLVDNMLSKYSINRRNIFDYSAIQNLYHAFYAGHKRIVFTKLWSLVVFELWCRYHIDGEDICSLFDEYVRKDGL